MFMARLVKLGTGLGWNNAPQMTARVNRRSAAHKIEIFGYANA